MIGEEVTNFNVQMTNYQAIIGWTPAYFKHQLKGRR